MKKFKEYLLENGISLTDQEIQQAFGYHKLGRTSFDESIRMVLGS